MADILSIIKRAAIEAVEAKKPVSIVFGRVLQAEPLWISIDQKLMLTGEQILVPEGLTDHEVVLEADWDTGSAGEDLHSHTLAGERKILLKNGLRSGDSVMMLRMDGGQRYIVMDRVAV